MTAELFQHSPSPPWAHKLTLERACCFPSVEQHVVYSIYDNGTPVLPYRRRGEDCLQEMIVGENKRHYHIRHMLHRYIYKIHNVTVTAIQRD